MSEKYPFLWMPSGVEITIFRRVVDSIYTCTDIRPIITVVFHKLKLYLFKILTTLRVPMIKQRLFDKLAI